MLRAILRWFLKTIGLIVLLFVIAIVADYVSHRVQPDSILVLKVDGPVVERGRVGVTSQRRAGRQTPINAARRALDLAARDKRIVGLVVKVIDPSLEFAQAQELSAMIRKFARSGKWTEA